MATEYCVYNQSWGGQFEGCWATRAEAEQVLINCHAVLTHEGLLEFTAPDLEAICKIVVTGKVPFEDHCIGWDQNKSREQGIRDYALSCLYGGQDNEFMIHKWGWSKDGITKLLTDNGFNIEKIDSSAYQPGTHLHVWARKT